MKALALAAVLCLLCAGAAAAQVLTVAWREKAPYQYVENGVEKGFLLERVKQVFAQSGVPARLVREPPKRIWANFQSGTKNYCSFGWYLLPEREVFAQYSAPIHVDPPHTVLIGPNAEAAVGAHATLASLLQDKTLSIGLVDGVSYGAELDARIKAGHNPVVRRTVEPIAMMRMIVAGRGAFMLADRDDLEYLRRTDATMARAVQHDFPDMPAGLKRYILCSKDVSPATMARLNRAIDGQRRGAAEDGRPAKKSPPV